MHPNSLYKICYGFFTSYKKVLGCWHLALWKNMYIFMLERISMHMCTARSNDQHTDSLDYYCP